MDQVPYEISQHLLIEVQDQRLGAEQDLVPLRTRKSLFWQLSRDGHVARASHDSLSKTILQDTLEGGRRRDWQRKCWMDNIKEWTFLPMPELLIKPVPNIRTVSVNIVCE